MDRARRKQLAKMRVPPTRPTSPVPKRPSRSSNYYWVQSNVKTYDTSADMNSLIDDLSLDFNSNHIDSKGIETMLTDTKAVLSKLSGDVNTSIARLSHARAVCETMNEQVREYMAVASELDDKSILSGENFDTQIKDIRLHQVGTVEAIRVLLRDMKRDAAKLHDDVQRFEDVRAQLNEEADMLQYELSECTNTLSFYEKFPHGIKQENQA